MGSWGSVHGVQYRPCQRTADAGLLCDASDTSARGHACLGAQPGAYRLRAAFHRRRHEFFLAGVSAARVEGKSAVFGQMLDSVKSGAAAVKQNINNYNTFVVTIDIDNRLAESCLVEFNSAEAPEARFLS
jgi:hypothetical protein